MYAGAELVHAVALSGYSALADHSGSYGLVSQRD